MPLKFSANLSFLFNDQDDLKNKYKAAKDAGFKAVEIGDPSMYDLPAEELGESAAECGIQHVLINTPVGNQCNDWGIASIPSRRQDFKVDLETGIKYAKALNCPRLHVLAGRRPPQWIDTAMDEVYLENMTYAAQRLQEEGLTLLMEVINPAVVLNYYLDSYAKAIEIIKKINKPNVKLQLDIFHLQTLAGNLTENIKSLLPYTDHVQIAQVPGRNEVNVEGEVNYQYILKLLKQQGYEGWIGLEYKPSNGSTTDSLKWMQQWGYAT